MSVWRLILNELTHRKLNFLLALLSVIVAVGVLTGMILALERHQAETERELAQREKVTNQRAKELDTYIKKATKGLGFNLRILPKDVNIAEYYAKGYSEQTMPESYVSKLANSDVVSVNHLLPVLQQKLEWTELSLPFKVLLVGQRGEVPFAKRDPKKPLEKRIPNGSIALGQELYRELKKQHKKDFKKGDVVKFRGTEYRIHEIKPKAGNQYDITVWMSLSDAQKLLNKPGKISGILALGCKCNAGRLATITADIQKELPEAQVDEHTMIATPRAKLRMQSLREAKRDKEELAKQRSDSYEVLEMLTVIVIPVAVLGCLVCLGVIALSNVNDRKSEIGILRALGVRSGKILTLFLSKSALVGLLGAILGILITWTGISLLTQPSMENSFVYFFKPMFFGVTVLVAPFVCLMASWLPALIAARQDPAVVLRD